MKDLKNYNQFKEWLIVEATPGKPETMAQKHSRMGGDVYSAKRKELLPFVQEIAKDWHSGDMTLARMESLITSDFDWLSANVSYGKNDKLDERDNLNLAFRKKLKAAGLESASRLGKSGDRFNPSMGKVTPNQIGKYFDLLVDFVKNDWLKVAPNN